VYAISTSSADGYPVRTIELPALADMGFRDSLGSPAGCFPNQVLSAALNGRYLYVTSICASPKGPTGAMFVAGSKCKTDADCVGVGLPRRSECMEERCYVSDDVKTTTAPVVHVIDTMEPDGTAAALLPTNLNAEFQKVFDARGVDNDYRRRYPLVPIDIAFTPDGSEAYVVANGADALFRFGAGIGGTVSVGDDSAMQPFVDLADPDVDIEVLGSAQSAADRCGGDRKCEETTQGQNPIGIAFARDAPFAFVNADVSRAISIVNLERQSVVRSVPLRQLARAERELNEGRRLFSTGLGRWSYRGQAWGACHTCHFEGFSDNVTWYLARGARQSVSLDGSFDKEPHRRRVFNSSTLGRSRATRARRSPEGKYSMTM
jgi:hypothetical protein